MRLLLLALLAAAPLAAPLAQVAPGAADPIYLGSSAAPTRVTALGVYQRYSGDGLALAQFTVPVQVTAPVAPGVGLSVRTGYTTVDGDDVAAVGALTDTQAALSYLRPVGAGRLVASLSVNLPTGKGELTEAEAETAFLVGQSFFGFRTPGLGQGFNAAGGLTWAVPVSERLAVGAGLAYQHRGPFRPRGGADAYDPGNEVLVTGGLDYRLGPSSTLALDLTYTVFGADAWGAVNYWSGNTLALAARLATELRRGEVQLLARVRTKGESEVRTVTVTPDPLPPAQAPDPSIPAQARLLGHVDYPLGERLHLGAYAQGRFYGASDLFAAKTLFDLGASPALRLSEELTLLARLALTFGDLSGVEIGGGLVVDL